VKVLVTGGNGFVGSWLLRLLVASGHDVVGAAGRESPAAILTEEERAQVRWVPLDLEDEASVERCLAEVGDAVVHLAGIASVADSLRDPFRAWRVNTLGTVRLLEALVGRHRREGADPVVLVASTAEVYGWGLPGLRTETDPVAPLSPYAASKAAGEVAALEVWRRTGLRVVVARPFPHTGPGQSTRFVVPAFVERIRAAKRAGTRGVKTGNLDPVRDLLDVRDVAAAYAALLARGVPGEIYNVAGGEGYRLAAVFERIGALAGYQVQPETDPALARAVDIPHLVGDAAKLRAATGWAPRFSLEQTLQQMLDAETD
jgi:GDP-4-dehydro-6-deoxy-D-mannose reductase